MSLCFMKGISFHFNICPRQMTAPSIFTCNLMNANFFVTSLEKGLLHNIFQITPSTCTYSCLYKISLRSQTCSRLPVKVHYQQTRGIHTMLFQCWPTVFDAGRTLKQHWTYAPCLMGYINGSPRLTFSSKLLHYATSRYYMSVTL